METTTEKDEGASGAPISDDDADELLGGAILVSVVVPSDEAFVSFLAGAANAEVDELLEGAKPLESTMNQCQEGGGSERSEIIGSGSERSEMIGNVGIGAL